MATPYGIGYFAIGLVVLVLIAFGYRVVTFVNAKRRAGKLAETIVPLMFAALMVGALGFVSYRIYEAEQRLEQAERESKAEMRELAESEADIEVLGGDNKAYLLQIVKTGKRFWLLNPSCGGLEKGDLTRLIKDGDNFRLVKVKSAGE